MSLSRILYSLPASRLREIVRARGSTLVGLPRVESKLDLARALASALTNYQSVQRVLAETSLPQFIVLRNLVVRGGEVPLSDLLREVDPSDAARLERTIDGLEILGLAYWIDTNGERKILVPRSIAQNVPLPASLRLRLDASLEWHASASLARICDVLGVRPEAKNKRALVAAVREAYRDREVIRREARGLSDEGKRILEMVITEGGEASLQSLASAVDSRRRRQVLDLTWIPYRGDAEPRNGVEELLARALAAQDQGTGWGSGRIVIPIEILEALVDAGSARVLPPEPRWERIPASSRPLQKHEGLVRDLACLFGFITRNEAPRTNAGVMYKTALRSLARGLTVTDQVYAEFVYALAADSGLIAAGGGKNLFAVTKRGRAWLSLSPEAQRRSLFDIWRASAAWSERQPEMLDDGKSYRNAAEDRVVRDRLFRLLDESSGEEPRDPVSVRSIAAQAYYRWWAYFSPETSSDNRGAPGIELVSRIAGMSLYWLGAVEAAFDSSGSAEAIRITERGRLWLRERPEAIGTAPTAEPDQPVKFILQPNLDIFAPPNLSASLFYRLFTIAEPAAGGIARVTRESLRQAMDAGESYESIASFFREHSQTGVPQNVDYLLREVGGRHGHIEVGRAGLYLKVDDPALLKELQAQRGLKIGFRRNLADNIALVTGDSVEGILKLLRQAGYFPVSNEENPRSSPAPKPRRRTEADLEEVFAESPARSSAAEIESRIDWDLMAAEDGTPYRGETDSSSTPSTPGAPPYLEALVSRAMEDSRCLEIIYKPSDGGSITQRVIEPVEISGPLVYAYCRLRQDWRNFNIRCIQSARLTGETFQAREL